ncbi:MAG: hypothetical protein PVH37_11220 [Desulfobacterales bacterium]|jgi:hypothetical protein
MSNVPDLPKQGIFKGQAPIVKIPKDKHQITNKSQFPILNDQNSFVTGTGNMYYKRPGIFGNL